MHFKGEGIATLLPFKSPAAENVIKCWLHNAITFCRIFMLPVISWYYLYCWIQRHGKTQRSHDILSRDGANPIQYQYQVRYWLKLDQVLVTMSPIQRADLFTLILCGRRALRHAWCMQLHAAAGHSVCAAAENCWRHGDTSLKYEESDEIWPAEHWHLNVEST